jgi:hypothetical protein
VTPSTGTKVPAYEPGDEILVPENRRGLENEARIRCVVVCRCYDPRQRLEPDEREPNALLGPDVRAL